MLRVLLAFFVLFSCGFPLVLRGQTPPLPSIKKRGGDLFCLGEITFDKKTKNIRFEVSVLIDDHTTLLEYLLIAHHGEKAHEALLETSIDPLHLNIVFKLLGYAESRELFRIDKEDGTPSKNYYTVSPQCAQNARFEIFIQEKGKEFESINRWIIHRITRQPLPKAPWVYHGSYLHRGKFKSRLTGSLFALLPDYGALGSYSGEEREDDTLWLVAPHVPKQGTKLLLEIRPSKQDKPLS